MLLDGLPENLALGIALVGSDGQQPLALLLSIFASNFPEALDGTTFILREGGSKRYAVSLWTITGGLLALTVVAGTTLFAGVSSDTLAVVRSLAAGARLAAITDEILPEAYEEGGPLVAIATTAGFFLTFLLQ